MLKLLELGLEPGTARRLAGKALALHKNPVEVTLIVKEAYRFYITEAPDVETDADESDLRNQKSYGEMERKGLIDEGER